MFLHVLKMEYLENYKIKVTFSNGAVKEVDLENELHGEIFEPLKDLEKFKKARINNDTNTIEWENGADFAPEFLSKIGKDVKQVA